MQEKSYQAAVYLRLSKEDGDIAEAGKQTSNSITNQKELVMDYLKSHPEITVVSTYMDDGFSGVDFDRPEFQRMLSDIREGKVNCVIVKDLSRFGRNYIEAGRYIEKVFPTMGVRFIAVTDGYDSIKGDMGTDMIIPFKNLINDAYCRDISIKVRSHMDIKRRNGDYIGAFAAYGYLKDKENKNHLVVDEYAADVVRDIYTMKLCGMSQQTIADKLNSDGILSPLQYKKSIGVRKKNGHLKSTKPCWSYNSVRRVLTNEVYTGMVVQGKSSTPNYKVKKRFKKDASEWIRVENMHEPIISRHEFDLVQHLLLRDTRVSPNRTEVYPLAGMLFCADCGEPMVRKTIPSGKKKHVYYVCSGNKKDKCSCSPHRFPEKKLIDNVLEVVRNYIGRVIAVDFAVEMLRKSSDLKPAVVKLDSRIEKLREELETCEKRKKNLYEDYKDGILTKSEYAMLRKRFNEQSDRVIKSIDTVTEERDAIMSNGDTVQEWVRIIKEYEGIDRLDRQLVTFLIERIEIVSAEVIHIIFRFDKVLNDLENVIEFYSEDKEAM